LLKDAQILKIKFLAFLKKLSTFKQSKPNIFVKVLVIGAKIDICD